MKISIHCIKCSEDNQSLYDMIPVGPRMRNRETNSQSQHYKCKECECEVAVIIEAEVMENEINKKNSATR